MLIAQIFKWYRDELLMIDDMKWLEKSRKANMYPFQASLGSSLSKKFMRSFKIWNQESTKLLVQDPSTRSYIFTFVALYILILTWVDIKWLGLCKNVWAFTYCYKWLYVSWSDNGVPRYVYLINDVWDILQHLKDCFEVTQVL